MYDLKEIKSISCADVAKKYGIELTRKHNRLWGKLRDEKTASFSINLEKNLWYDFGSGKGGSVIDLVAEIEGISPTDAINKLAQEYGFEKEKTQGWRPLTDKQYRELGIQPERATMNFGFDLNKHTVEQLERWSKKYGIPVKDLAEKYPSVYNKMVKKIALETINVLRDTYYSRLKMLQDTKNNEITKGFLKEMAKENAIEINTKVDLLNKALKYSKTNYNDLKVDIDKDLKELEKKSQQRALTDDEKIRERIVKVYKKLFNFNQADYFKIEHAKALYEFNRAITKADNKYLSIKDIKNSYKMIGKKLESIENEYKNALQVGDKIKIDDINNKLNKIKDLFKKCSIAIEGIREANIAFKNEISKQNITEKTKEKIIENTMEIG